MSKLNVSLFLVLLYCIDKGSAMKTFKPQKYFNLLFFTAFSHCEIKINGGLGENQTFWWSKTSFQRFLKTGEPQPLLIRPGTTQLFYPSSKYGVIYLEEGEQIELYCSTGFSAPYEAGTTFLATCSYDNQFSFNGINYDFSSFYCKGFTASEVRKTSERCYNNGYVVQHGFPVGSKFVNIYEACHNDEREETYYVKHHFTPSNSGFQTGSFDVFISESQSRVTDKLLFRLFTTKLRHWWTFRRQRCR